MKIKLTIVIPLYNQEKYIRQCIESILHQSLIEISLIIVNDGSTDGSLDICNEIATTDDRVTIISQDNQGLAGARLTGIKNTETKYITFVDADDFILPDAYETAIPYLNDEIDEIFFEMARYYSEHKIKKEHHIISPGMYDKKRIAEQIYPKLVWDFVRKTPGLECSQCVRIVKTELLKKAYENLKVKRFYYGEDIAITYPLITSIKSMVVIPQSYYMHRQRESSNIPGYISNRGYFEEVSSLCSYIREEMAHNIEGYNFDSQIDYFYMYSVELKKLCYDDYSYTRDFLFPFNLVPFGNSIVLYGAGDVGKAYYEQILKLKYCSEIIWVDKNAKYISDDRVSDLEILDTQSIQGVQYIVIAIENKDVCEQIKRDLVNKGFDENIIGY